MSLTTFFNFLETLVKDTRRIKDNRIIMFIICLLYLIFHLVTRHSHTAWTRAPGTVGTPGTPGVPLHSPRVHTCPGQTWNVMHSRFLMRSLSLHLSKSIVFMFWIHTGVIFSFVLFEFCHLATCSASCFVIPSGSLSLTFDLIREAAYSLQHAWHADSEMGLSPFELENCSVLLLMQNVLPLKNTSWQSQANCKSWVCQYHRYR